MGKQAGGGRNRTRARAGVMGQGVRTSWQEGAEIGGELEGRRGRRGWKN